MTSDVSMPQDYYICAFDAAGARRVAILLYQGRLPVAKRHMSLTDAKASRNAMNSDGTCQPLANNIYGYRLSGPKDLPFIARFL